MSKKGKLSLSPCFTNILLASFPTVFNRIITFLIPRLRNLSPSHCSVVVITSTSNTDLLHVFWPIPRHHRPCLGTASTARTNASPSNCPSSLLGGPAQSTLHRLLKRSCPLLTCPPWCLYHLRLRLAACYGKSQITTAQTLHFSNFQGVWK